MLNSAKFEHQLCNMQPSINAARQQADKKALKIDVKKIRLHFSQYI